MHYCLNNNRYIQWFHPLYTCIWQHTCTFSDNDTITVWNCVAAVTHSRKHSSETGWRMRRNHSGSGNEGSRKHLTGFPDVSHNETVGWVFRFRGLRRWRRDRVSTWACVTGLRRTERRIHIHMRSTVRFPKPSPSEHMMRFINSRLIRN